MDWSEYFRTYDNYCFFMNPANGVSLLSKDDYEDMVEFMEMDIEVQAEIEAERAWLRKAESATLDDMGFERYEWERMYS